MALEPLVRFKGHKAAVLCIAHAKQSILGSHVLASGSEDKTCRLWDIRQQRAVKGIHNLDDAVSSVMFATQSDLPHLYVACGTKVHTYDLRNTNMILTESIRHYDLSEEEINSMDINDKNTFMAVADDLGQVKVVDLQKHTMYKKLVKKHQNICMAVRFKPKKPWQVWSGGMDSFVIDWDFSRGRPSNIYNMNEDIPQEGYMFNPPFVYTLAMSTDGRWTAAGLGDGSIKLIETSKKPTVGSARIANAHTHIVNCLSFLPSHNNRLMSASVNGTVAIWALDAPLQEAEPIQRYQLDASMFKLNWIETFDLEGKGIHMAAAGVSETANNGVLNMYAPPL